MSGLIQSSVAALAMVAAGVVYVEKFRPGATDSEAIQAALDHVGTAYAGKLARIKFEAGREYVYDTTGNLKNINNLIIDLNGATLKRAPSALTVTTTAQDAGTGQATVYLTAVPVCWKVGDFLTAFYGPEDSKTARDPIRIVGINRGNNSVSLYSGLGAFGDYQAIIPAGCKVGKNFSAFAGRPSSVEAQAVLTPGVNENVHICNGTIDGNGANQVNSSWRYACEIFIQGNRSSVTNMTFRDTTAECIVGHGLQVAGNRFLNMGGSCLHTSVHDDTLSKNSMSWFVNNFVDGVNKKTQAVVGHAEGAITFSWGAGRLVVANNDMRNGLEGVLGAFGPSSGPMGDKWLIVSGNICNTFRTLFYDIAVPVEGVIVHQNVFVNIDTISEKTTLLLQSGSSSVGGNVVIGNSPINGAFRASQAVFGPLGAGSIEQVKLWARRDAVEGFNYGWLSEQAVAVEGTAAAGLAFVSGNGGNSSLSFYSPGGSQYGSYFISWNPATKRMKLLNNEEGGALELATPIIASQLPGPYNSNAEAVAAGQPVNKIYRDANGFIRVVM